MLKINKIETSKHKIPQRLLMTQGIIPNHPSVSVMSGSQGGGKSTLVANLLMNPYMYGSSFEGLEKELKKHPKTTMEQPYFDAIFLFIGSDDDMYDHLIDSDIIKQNHVCKTPSAMEIQKVIDNQKAIIDKSKGNMLHVPKILFIFDDVVNDGMLMRSRPMLELFVKGRHLNSSTWMLSQYLNLISKPMRLQANFLFVFKCNRAELEVLADQFTPPTMTKKEFSSMVQETNRDNDESKNNFLLIVKRAPEDQRFRKNLEEFVVLKRLKYQPKLDKLPPPKELEDREFDMENTIKDIQQDYSHIARASFANHKEAYEEIDRQFAKVHKSDKPKDKTKPKKGRPRKKNPYSKR